VANLPNFEVILSIFSLYLRSFVCILLKRFLFKVSTQKNFANDFFSFSGFYSKEFRIHHRTDERQRLSCCHRQSGWKGLFVHVFVYLFIRLFVYLFVHLFSVCLFVCLFAEIWNYLLVIILFKIFRQKFGSYQVLSIP
jgi:hypothetical protein